MPKVKYHNLQGWMRDVRQAMREGDQCAYELAELLLDVDDLVDPNVAAAVEAADDDTDDALDDDQGDVESQGLQSRPEGDGVLGGPVPRSAGNSAQTGGLDRLLALLPREQRAQAESELNELRNRAVGSPGKRLSAMPTGAE